METTSSIDAGAILHEEARREERALRSEGSRAANFDLAALQTRAEALKFAL